MRHGRTVSVLLLACLMVLTACAGEGGESNQTGAGDYPVTVRNCGHEVTIDKPPKRVFLLSNEAVTLLTAVDALDRVVARSGKIQTELYNRSTTAALRRIPRVGRGTSALGTDQISLEALVAKQPDLVVGYTPDNSGITRASLARLGIPLLVPPENCTDPQQVSKKSFTDVYARVELYGRIFDARHEARRAVAELRKRVAAVKKTHQGSRNTTAAALFVYLGGTPPSAYGSRSMAHAQMNALGLTNVFGNIDKRNFEAGTETLVAKNPDVLILYYVGGDPATIEHKLRGVQDMNAVAAVDKDHIVIQHFGFSASPTPLSVTGLEHMAHTLHARTDRSE